MNHPILTRSNYPVFYRTSIRRINNGRIYEDYLQGLLANEDPNMLFRHINLNIFEETAIRIPENAILSETPDLEWMNKFFINPDKSLLICPNTPPVDIKQFNYYKIIDDYGISCIVYIHPNTQEVYVYKIPESGYINDTNNSNEHTINYYTKCVFHFKSTVKIWIYIDNKYQTHENNILIQITAKSYIYIGSSIKIFVSKDPITDYYFIIGNDRVSHHVAITKNDVLFMLDGIKVPEYEFLPFIPSDKMSNEKYWINAYAQFHNYYDSFTKTPFDTMKKYIKIANRNALWKRMIVSFKERFYDPDKGNYLSLGCDRFNKKRKISQAL
jgi:hypothetical protein